jgi:hypothetical protein
LGLVGLSVGLALVAGLYAFLIEYEQNLHRFSVARARRRAHATGAVAASFFAGLGILLATVLLR